MKSEELRIGNYINFQIGKSLKNGFVENIGIQKVVIVSSIRHSVKSCNIIPILLTKEWLLGFGWGEDDYWDAVFKDNVSLKDIVLEYNTDCNVLSIETDSDVIELTHIKYVHQLQNLYFALTGEELVIKYGI